MILSLDGDYGVVESVVVVENANQPMFNLTVDDVHTFAVGDGDWIVHNTLGGGCGDYPDSIQDPRDGQTYNRPTLPDSTIASQGSVRAEQYYHTNDHAPTHIHIIDGKKKTRIGPDLEPLSGDPSLTTAMRRFVNNHRETLRRAMRKIQNVMAYRTRVDEIRTLD